MFVVAWPLGPGPGGGAGISVHVLLRCLSCCEKLHSANTQCARTLKVRSGHRFMHSDFSNNRGIVADMTPCNKLL